MKLLITLAILLGSISSFADSYEYCEAMNLVDSANNKARCYQLAPLANKDVIRMVANLKDSIFQKMALDAIEINPTQITSTQLAQCVWDVQQENAGLAMKCLEDLKVKEKSFFN